MRQYVWGEGIDECLKAHLLDAADIDADSDTTDFVDLYYHHNSIGSVVAVTNAAGAVKESYRYSAFGKPTIYNASNVEIAATAVKQPFMFTGARYDFEEGSSLYQMRHRYYDPVVGRFVSRDPLGLWGDPSQTGNGQGYCGHNPVNRKDPLGLDVFDDAWNWARKEWDDATTIRPGTKDMWRNFRTRLGEAIDAAVELARPTEDDFKIAGAALAIPDPGVTEAVAIGVILARRYKIFQKFRTLARLRRARASSGLHVPDRLPDGPGHMPDAPGPGPAAGPGAGASGPGAGSGGAGQKPPQGPKAPPGAGGQNDEPRGDWEWLWEKHGDEFDDLPGPDALPDFVRGIKNKKCTQRRDRLRNGREAWYDPETNTIVIEQGGEVTTVFKPKDGESYFDDLE